MWIVFCQDTAKWTLDRVTKYHEYESCPLLEKMKFRAEPPLWHNGPGPCSEGSNFAFPAVGWEREKLDGK